jgi:hypothetical protein
MLAAATLALAGTPPEEPVLTGPAHQSQPAQARTKGKDILVWTQAAAATPNRWNVFLRRGTSPAIRLNTKGRGYNGDVAPPWVAYQQVVAGKSDLKLYRLDTRKRVPLPAGINTKHWEWRPRISGNWILFGRESVTSSRQTLLLVNRRTKAKRTLAAVTGDHDLLVPGQIAGNWVVWNTCTPVCSAFRYGIEQRSKLKLGTPTGGSEPVHVYAPAVTKSGVVYAGQGPAGCGNGAQLVRYGGAGDPPAGTPLVSFPLGVDISWTFARRKADGSVDVLYSRATCSPPNGFDVYRITDPAAP